MKIIICIMFSILFCNTSYAQNIDSLINAEIDNAKKKTGTLWGVKVALK